MTIQPAHLIIYNSRIYNQSPYNTALAIRDGEIAAIGSDNDILPMTGKQTKRIVGRGRWILPALMDSHTHVIGYAARKLQVDLSDCESLAEGLKKITVRVESSPEGDWITGGGWDKNKWNLSDFPSKQLLDEISARHFIALDSKDWHSLWVNSPVLEKCAISRDASDPPGGNIIRDENGEPSGIFQETARNLIFEEIPPPSVDKLLPAVLETFQKFHQFGITSAHSMETFSDFSIYQRLFEEGKLGLRIFWYLPGKQLSAVDELDGRLRSGNSFVKICGVKLFADGALGSQSAEMLEDYNGLDHAGISVLSREELRELVGKCVSQKLACAIHAIGDKANRKVLSTFREFFRESQNAGLRHRVEHAQLLHPDDITSFQKYDVIASMQPIHLAADIPMIEEYWGERGRLAYAFASLANSGARLIFGSDTPIESFDPWKAIYTAVERKVLVNPKADSFYPEERITINQAIQAYTSGSSWAVGEELSLGSLEIGKQADLIMLDQDIFSESSEVLLSTKVLLTLLSGKVVYQNVDFD
jgi:predicted amidohydrolase YtcJ